MILNNIDNAMLGTDQVDKIYLGADEIWTATPDAELIYNGEPVTGTSHGATAIYINSTDTSVTFDVRTKNQNTPWVITHGEAGEQARGTGSTQNGNVEVLPNIPEWIMEQQTLVYKKDGDQDDVYVDWMGWTGEASVIRYTVNS